MDIYVRDKSLNVIAVIDVYTSLIWTKRYYECGDFELYLPATQKMVELLQKDYYLSRLDDETVMIIEKIEITTDAESGDFLIVTGRSIESILSRRIIWNQTVLNGTAENAIRKLINENIISPNISNRKINNFVLGELQGFSETLSAQFTGNNLMETIVVLCQNFGYGWKITLNSNNQFVFSLYRGTDRSYNQAQNPHVVFSHDFDNLLTSDYYCDVSNYSNVALVAGEGEGNARKTQTIGNSTGLNRRELYVDARDISSNNGEISQAEYNNQLIGRGSEKLAESTITESFVGEIIPNIMYQYMSDYFVGDIVQVANAFGISASSRIIEMIESEDQNGIKYTPTFEEWTI